MNPWQTVLVTVGGLVLSYLTARMASRASVRVAQISVEAKAFEGASKIYEGSIGRLEKENEQLRKDLATEKKAREDLEEKHTVLKGEFDTVRQQLTALQRLLPDNPDNPHHSI